MRLLSVLVVATLSTANASAQEAEVVYSNAVIWTGSAASPSAEAIAVQGGRILSIGSNEDVVVHAGEGTRVIDLGGHFVVPGFIDSHVHFMSGGFQLASVDLRSAESPEEFAARMADYARGAEGGWITGGDWDHERWGGELPHRSWIDEGTPDTPVFVQRLDGHMGLANSLALSLAGVTRETPDPPGGTIVRDGATGEPTGILKDEAMSLVYRVLPAPSAEERAEALDRATSHALAHGITQVHDMGGWSDLEAYRQAAADDRLGIRIYSFVPLRSWQRLAEYVDRNGRGDDMLRWGGLKGFVDGSLGSTTAWFYDPYDDAPETSGLMVTDTTELSNWIAAADERQLHVVVHAIGDRANDWLLDVFAAAAEANGSRDRRFRIEHAQHLSPAALARFGAEHVAPSMQPYHAIDDGRWAEKRIGPERILRTYAFRSLLDASAPLAFGSDWTVAPISPLEGIYAAVTRRTLDGRYSGGWVASEKISVQEALKAYTFGSAYAGFHEDRTGRLEPGMLADFAVLSDNLFEIEPEAIADVQVLRTVVAGESRFTAGD